MAIHFQNGDFGQNFRDFASAAGVGGQPFSGGQPRPGRPRKGIRSRGVRVLVNLLVTAGVGALLYYVALPPLNAHSGGFYWFIVALCVVYLLISSLTAGSGGQDGEKKTGKHLWNKVSVPVLIIGAVIVVAIAGAVSSWVFFRAGSYAQLLTVDTSGNFADDVEELSFDQIPLLDSASAMQLGSRKLGELSDMVSQFEVADDYTQINYKNAPVRVTPLVYGDIIKWFTNRASGIPAYLIINMTTSNVEVVRLSEGIKYTTAEHFNRNLYRYLRFHYPTYLFEEPAFEIDDSGVPYWVCARATRTIGLFGGKDLLGAVLVNAVTGECTYYNISDVPEWVDRVYNADLIVNQYNYYGKYHNGFWNSIFGQRDVTVTTDGYNYLALDDDVYMYTGVTSVGGDESNVGFLLCNQRTKECKYYSCAGAEEYSAMDSAQGIVQQMHYEATFPILLNISGQPTYFMALKDSGGLVKQYAMVNMSQYQIVANGTTVQGCLSTYLQLMAENGLQVTTQVEDTAADKTVSGRIADLRSAVVDGNTVYYLCLEGSTQYYRISAADCETAVLLGVGDGVSVTYTPDSGDILRASDVTRLSAAAKTG